MMKKNKLIAACAGSAIALSVMAASLTNAADDVANTPLITPKTMADALHLVLDSDRAVYTRRIVNRLAAKEKVITCLLYTSPSPRDKRQSRMPSSA